MRSHPPAPQQTNACYCNKRNSNNPPQIDFIPDPSQLLPRTALEQHSTMSSRAFTSILRHARALSTQSATNPFGAASRGEASALRGMAEGLQAAPQQATQSDGRSHVRAPAVEDADDGMCSSEYPMDTSFRRIRQPRRMVHPEADDDRMCY
jgi:hypothetical protein